MPHRSLRRHKVDAPQSVRRVLQIAAYSPSPGPRLERETNSDRSYGCRALRPCHLLLKNVDGDADGGDGSLIFNPMMNCLFVLGPGVPCMILLRHATHVGDQRSGEQIEEAWARLGIFVA